MQAANDPTHKRRRTPQACVTCRRRKTKCDGVRPRCRHCNSRKIACIWPDEEAQQHAAITAANAFTGSPAPPTVKLPSRHVMRRIFDIYFDYHSTSTFCSFLYRPDLDNHTVDEPFLNAAMICLCARYLTPAQAAEDFGARDGREVVRMFVPIAKSMARAVSDQPSVLHMQANLILAVSEFFDHDGCTHWIYAGNARNMAEIMRLNTEFHRGHSLKQREIRRRTFWACVMIGDWFAYMLAKAAVFPSRNITACLPGSDASLVYREPTKGLMLDTMGAESVKSPSEIGILPYLVKTAYLWSEMMDLLARNFRFSFKMPPNDPSSPFLQRHTEMLEWTAALPPTLQWSESNYSNHSTLGHGREFVAIHMLIRSASVAAHHSYLPHMDNASFLATCVDGAGWSLLARHPELIGTCVTNALEAVQIAQFLFHHPNPRARAELLSIHALGALYSICNTLLWLQFSQDPEYGRHAEQAARYFELVLDIMSTWEDFCSAATHWLTILRAMRAMYRAAYLNEIEDEVITTLAGQMPGSNDGSQADPSPQTSTSGPSIAGNPSSNRLAVPSETTVSRPGWRPSPGDAFPTSETYTTLYDLLRLLASDTSAENSRLQAVWMQFASGWPQGMLLGTDDDLGFGAYDMDQFGGFALNGSIGGAATIPTPTSATYGS